MADAKGRVGGHRAFIRLCRQLRIANVGTNRLTMIGRPRVRAVSCFAVACRARALGELLRTWKMMTVHGVYTVCSGLSERRCSADAELEHNRHGLDAGHCVASLGVVAFVLHAAPLSAAARRRTASVCVDEHNQRWMFWARGRELTMS